MTVSVIARPSGLGWRGQQDYVLLMQQRSDQVLNARRSLAAIPKAFHQPLVEPAMETSLLRRLLRSERWSDRPRFQ